MPSLKVREANNRVAEAEELVLRLKLLVAHKAQFRGDIEQAMASLAAMRQAARGTGSTSPRSGR